MNTRHIYYSCSTWLSYYIGERYYGGRRGIQKGAANKRNEGTINHEEYLEIQQMAVQAEMSKFRPLMLIIPVQPIVSQFKRGGVRERANPLSEEYIIENLLRQFFDAFEL